MLAQLAVFDDERRTQHGRIEMVAPHAAQPRIHDQVVPLRLAAFGDTDQFIDVLVALAADDNTPISW